MGTGTRVHRGFHPSPASSEGGKDEGASYRLRPHVGVDRLHRRQDPRSARMTCPGDGRRGMDHYPELLGPCAESAQPWCIRRAPRLPTQQVGVVVESTSKSSKGTA